ncbi:MAG: c-type cytochrome [Actinomycetota bacterium]
MATSDDLRTKRATRLLLFAVAALSLLVAACAGDVAAPEVPGGDPQLVEGRDIYIANCATCHGATGEGGRGSKLNEGRVLERYPEIVDQIELVAGGNGAMPAFSGRLSEAEIEAVVRYTRDILAETENE